MTAPAGTKPHPIFLAGRWVESPDPLVITGETLAPLDARERETLVTLLAKLR